MEDKNIKEEIEKEDKVEPTDTEDKDNRSIGEKIEDTMDDVVAGVQDFFYGPKGDSNEDIPATIMDPDNEIRHINKIQTRRNFNKKYAFKILIGFFVGVPILLIFFVVLGVIINLIF